MNIIIIEIKRGIRVANGDIFKVNIPVFKTIITYILLLDTVYNRDWKCCYQREYVRHVHTYGKDMRERRELS